MLQTPERLPDRIAQLLFPRIGSNMPPGRPPEKDEAHIADLLDRHAIGGLVLFHGDRIRTPHTLFSLQSLARFPLLIASDIERGAGQQIRGATVFPHALAFDALDNSEDAVEKAARVTAREALAVGMHVGLGPVADIHSNENNPIISLRAFGRDADSASRHAAAWIRGSRTEGLLSCAKHFPGHGDTTGDSHDSLPRVDADRATLEERELAPFRRAIQEGVELVMTAHVAYPALDPEVGPATASRPIMHDLLRDEMKFRGALISDSLLMAGAGPNAHSAGEYAAKLLKAGVDILLDVDDVDPIVDYLTTAVRSGALDESVIDTAFRRVWALKARLAARFGDGVFLDPGLAFPPSEAGNETNRAAAADIARRSITVLSGSERNTGLEAVDSDTGKGLLGVTVLANARHADPTGSSLLEAGPARWPEATWLTVSPDTTAEERSDLIAEASRHECVLVAAVVKPAAWHQYGLPDEMVALAADLLDRPGAVLACMGPASIADRLTGASLTLGAHSDVQPSFVAVVERIRAISRAHASAGPRSFPLP